jgi:hypothetical protein
MSHAQRGQTLPEAVFFLPIVLLALFGTIYVSQFWVVAERTQLAIRYGSPVTNPAADYNVANIYKAATNPTNAACTSAPLTVLWDGAPLPGPTSAPYWQPSASPAPSSTCSTTFSKNQGAQFLALYVQSTQLNMTTSVNVPQFLVNFAGLGSFSSTSASQAFGRPADPAGIMCHSKEVNARVTAALNVPSPAPTTTPIGTPSPLPFGSVC